MAGELAESEAAGEAQDAAMQARDSPRTTEALVPGEGEAQADQELTPAGEP